MGSQGTPEDADEGCGTEVLAIEATLIRGAAALRGGAAAVQRVAGGLGADSGVAIVGDALVLRGLAASVGVRAARDGVVALFGVLIPRAGRIGGACGKDEKQGDCQQSHGVLPSPRICRVFFIATTVSFGVVYGRPIRATPLASMPARGE